MRTGIDGGPGTKDPSRATFTRFRLASLISYAYDLKLYQSDYRDSRLQDEYEVAVVLPEGSTKEQFHAVLRDLLTERFHLRVHWEQKPSDVYDLIQAKGGHKLKPPTPPGETTGFSGMPEKDADNLPKIPPGQSMQVCAYGGCRMQWYSDNLDRIRLILSSELNAPINDATGLTGVFNYVLSYGPPATQPNRPDDAPPPLIDAVADQLGLRIEKRKGEITFLIVDSVDKTPTEN